MNLHIGQKVYLKAANNNAIGRKETYVKQDIITKIGREYVTVGNYIPPIQFEISNNFRQKSKYIPDWELYFSEQEIHDEEEFIVLFSEIRKIFNVYNKQKQTLDQLRKIKAILNESI